MRRAGNSFLILVVCAGCAIAGPMFTSATADISLNGFVGHSAQQGTDSASASVFENDRISATGSASISGWTLDAYTLSYYSSAQSYGNVASSAEAVLSDVLYLAAPYGHVEMDVVVNDSRASKGGQTGVEVWVDDRYQSWNYMAGTIPSLPLTITTGGSDGPYPIAIRISARVWAKSQADGVGNALASTNLSIGSIRVYDFSSRQVTGFTYRSDSGMFYPVADATFDNVPEPGTVTLLIVGGVLAVAGRKLKTVWKHFR